MLSDAEIASFIEDGYVRIGGAVPQALSDAALEVLWADLAVDPHDPATWNRPMVRLGHYGQPVFR